MEGTCSSVRMLESLHGMLAAQCTSTSRRGAVRLQTASGREKCPHLGSDVHHLLNENVIAKTLTPGRNYIPPLSHFWPLGILQWRGVGVHSLRDPAAGILCVLLFYTPPLLGGCFQGGCIKFWPRIDHPQIRRCKSWLADRCFGVCSDL